MCILSLKGATYFFCALHIADSLFHLWTFIFDVIQLLKLNEYYPKDANDPSVILEYTLTGIYITSAVILECLIFRGIETKSLCLLFGGVAALFILQCSAFIRVLCVWEVEDVLDDPFGILEYAKIGRFVWRTIGMLAFGIILGAFGKSIKKERRHEAAGYLNVVELSPR